MKTRYTKTNLIADLEELNTQFKKESLDYVFKYQHRNGYHAVDLYENGKCLSCVDCNETPKILMLMAKLKFDYIVGYVVQG